MAPTVPQKRRSMSFAIPRRNLTAPPPPRGNIMADLGFIQDEDGSIRIEDLVIPPAPVPVLSADVPTTRLVITHLNVKNFKSYEGEQVIGPFDKYFTAIVGPNGSGKSNVIDALMFVFGRKSKDIRAKKVANLIHKSKRHREIPSCSVAVNFAMVTKTKDEEEVKVKDSGFIVSRTVNADGSSYYEICHKRVQYKEVVRTLRAYGIDMEYNRFLIMQGEIESIALMNPKATPKDSAGMLEYIEDVIGSHRLIEPIKYFSDKADELKLQENNKAKELELFEKEKNELEGPKNQAIAYLRLENKHILCENSLLHFQRLKAEKELEGIVDAKKKFVEEMKSLKAEMGKVQESKKSLESNLTELAKKHDVILRKHDEHSEEFKALVREDAANLMDIKHVKGKTQAMKKTLEDSQNEINKLTKQLATYESETIELQIKKTKLEEDKAVDEKKATEVMGTLKQETKIMQEQKDVLESELIKLKENVYQIKSEIDLTKSELNICVSGDKKEKEKLSSLLSNHKTNLESAKQEEVLVLQETNQIREIEIELSSLKEQLSSAKENELSLLQQYREKRQNFEEARNSQQTSRNSSSLLKALLKEKSAGRLPGIYGRLGDLGAIDEKYDVAMSTACGRLDNIVTDTLSTAQACVEYLKKNNLGYATFIALDQMKRYQHKVHEKITTPENVPRLFDLIRVNDEALLPAFYFAISDTLVSEDLQQATRIGLNGSVRRRVVSLQGKLVEASGAMTGGGTHVIKGRIGQKVVESGYSDEQLAKMSDGVNALTIKASEVKRLCESLEDQISQKINQLSSLKHSLKKRSMRCNAFKGQVEMIASQITEQEEKIGKSTIDKKKVSLLEEKIKAKEKIYNKSVQETAVVEAKVSELQAKILEISKGKFSKAKKTVEQLKKKLDEVTQAITKSSVNMKQSKTKVKKLETKIQNIQKDLEVNEREYQSLKDKRDTITAKGQKTSELVTQCEEELAEYVEKQKKLKKEIAVINGKEHEMKLNEIEHKNTLKNHEANEAEKRASVRSLNSKLGKLKLTEVEDDATEIPTLSDEEISKLNPQNLLSDLDIMKVQLEDMKPELSSIKEYKIKERMYKEKLEDLKEIRKDRILQEKRKLELYKKRLAEFMSAFIIITKKNKEIYQMLTQGGDAELELVNKNDPFDGGIIYSVRPPKKAWKTMSNLSGGEKTLSSLALVFSLHYYRTTPFYVMDEIDAALDEKNVGIIGKFLMVHQRNAQFIIVSLRNVMNELPNYLLGVFKTGDCTKNTHLEDCDKWFLGDEPQEEVANHAN